MALTSYESKVWEECEEYFGVPEETMFGKMSKAFFRPVEVVADRVIPGRLLEAVGDAVEVTLKTISNIANQTAGVNGILESFRGLGLKVEEVSDLDDADFRLMDDVCEAAISNDSVLASFEGAGCGYGGVMLLAADIPLLFGISFRAIRKIATCYGFDPNDEGERAIAFKIFELASGGTRNRYDKFLELEALTDELDGLPPKERAEKAAVVGALLASREAVKHIVSAIVSRKLAQSVPIVGALVGAGFNYLFVKDVCNVAQQVYRRRVLARRRRSDGTARKQAQAEPAAPSPQEAEPEAPREAH